VFGVLVLVQLLHHDAEDVGDVLVERAGLVAIDQRRVVLENGVLYIIC
jgi:hypothetical protein